MNILSTLKKELQTLNGRIASVALVLAFLLAIFPLYHQLFFYYDQARDGYEAYNIWHNHDLKILGPNTDIPFLHHGVLWYYLLAILYGIFQQNVLPVAAIFLLAFFASLPAVWILTNNLFRDRLAAYLATILYAFSPLFQLSTRWLSNPVLSFILMPVLLLVLWQFIEKQTSRNSLLLAIIYGLVIQSQLAFGALLMFLPVYLLVFKVKINLKHLILFFTGLLISTSTIILGEVKYHFQGMQSLFNSLATSHKMSQSLTQTLAHIFEKINSLVFISNLPLPSLLPLLALIILLILVIVKEKNINFKPFLFIGIWLINLVIFTLFDTGISRSLFVFYPSVLPVVILTSYLLVKLLKKKVFIFLVALILIGFQLRINLNWIKNTQNPLTVQEGITLNLERQILDYTYVSSGRKPFSINTITEPLFINTTWAYLYNFYAKPEYGYLPYWSGKDQTNRLGNLPLSKTQPLYHYLIIEPTTGIPDYFVKAAINEEDTRSKITEVKHFGNFIVQKRQMLVEQK